jgi:hypothetical protein
MIFLSILTYFKKIVWPYLVDSENFEHQECNFRKKTTKILENVFSKQLILFMKLKKPKITEAKSVYSWNKKLFLEVECFVYIPRFN